MAERKKDQPKGAGRVSRRTFLEMTSGVGVAAAGLLGACSDRKSVV